MVLIGDADQLPAVGAGNVLKDLIASGMVPCQKLTKVFRQAAESLIISYAHQINRGEVPRIESPFHQPTVWQEKVDCLFIDSEEATTEQLNFIKKIKRVTQAPVNLTVKDHNLLEEPPGTYQTSDLYTQGSTFSIPAKFSHGNIAALQQSQSYSQDLKEVL